MASESATIPTYEALTGRVLSVSVATPAEAASPKVMQYYYDLDGRATQIRDSNKTIANLTYEATGELKKETHPNTAADLGNGSTWTPGRNAITGAIESSKWEFPSGADTLIDTVARSQSGRIVLDTVTKDHYKSFINIRDPLGIAYGNRITKPITGNFIRDFWASTRWGSRMNGRGR